MDSNRIWYRGIPFNNCNYDESISILTNYIESVSPHQHVVVNLAKLVSAEKSEQLKNDILNANFIGTDGGAIRVASSLSGVSLPNHRTGCDLFLDLLKVCEKNGFGVYFFGASPNNIEKFVSEVKLLYPNLIISGFQHGHIKRTHDNKNFDSEAMVVVANSIKLSGAKFLAVGISSPFKENFIASHLDSLGVGLVMGVGGSFDVVAKVTTRAPEWMQKTALEWAYRLYQEPSRMFNRYFSTAVGGLYIIFSENCRRVKKLFGGRRK